MPAWLLLLLASPQPVPFEPPLPIPLVPREEPAFRIGPEARAAMHLCESDWWRVSAILARGGVGPCGEVYLGHGVACRAECLPLPSVAVDYYPIEGLQLSLTLDLWRGRLRPGWVLHF